MLVNNERTDFFSRCKSLTKMVCGRWFIPLSCNQPVARLIF
jgi:hypothetical protein